MKKEQLSCKVIQDLLPLYEDNCCSEDSKCLIEEHLKNCEECQKKSKNFQTEILLPEVTPMDPDEQVIIKGIRKLKHIKVIGITALAICLAIIFVMVPIIHYKVGTGITYANLNEIHMAKQFVRALQEKDFEKAYGYLNIQEHYENLINEDYNNIEGGDGASSIADGIQQIRKNGFGWYDEACKEKFMGNMQVLEDSGAVIESYSYREVYKQNNEWDVYFIVEADDGTIFNLQITLNNDGINNFNPTMNYLNKDEEINLGIDTVDLYLSDYYIMPTLNEAVMEVLYEGSGYDWAELFDHKY